MIWLLEERSHGGIFGRAFMSLAWNLMCRGVNTCVCLKHLMWRADAFGISFSHVKNDPAGSRNWHPRHIYTNPDNYHVCCVTAVTEYLLFSHKSSRMGMVCYSQVPSKRNDLGLSYYMC